MEVFIYQVLVEQIAIHIDKGNELMICRYIGEKPYKYSTWRKNGWLTRKIQPQALMFCIRRKDSNVVAVVTRFKGMPSAMKFFDEQVEAIHSGKLKIDCNYE